MMQLDIGRLVFVDSASRVITRNWGSIGIWIYAGFGWQVWQFRINWDICQSPEMMATQVVFSCNSLNYFSFTKIINF